MANLEEQKTKQKLENQKMIEYFKKNFLLDSKGKHKKDIKVIDEQQGMYQGGILNGKKNGKGIFEYSNGSIYIGDWKDNSFSGIGIFIFKNGDRYEGQLNQDQKNGKGQYYYMNGNVYDGEWKSDKKNGQGKYTYFGTGEEYNGQWLENKKHGKGQFKFATGDIFEGDYVDGKKKGQGIIKFKSGAVFQGDWINDRATGQGVLTYQNGDKYEGMFENSKKNGQGIYKFQNGTVFEGSFKRDQIVGKGQIIFPNGDKYEGDFLNNMKHGNGKYQFKTGDSYNGQWIKDNKDGQGNYYYADKNDNYIGEWKGNKKQGKGKYIFSNGDVYEGDFNNGVKEGQGTVIWSNGDKYIGEWSNDMMHGYGKIYTSDGRSKDVVIRENQILDNQFIFKNYNFYMEEIQSETQEEIKKKNLEKWNPLLIEAARNNDINLLEQALKNSAEINYSDNNSWNALMWACCNGNFQMVEKLIKRGALSFYDVIDYQRKSFVSREIYQLGSIKDKFKRSPLQVASVKGFADIIGFLIKKGFSWKDSDIYNTNCFQMACSSNDLESVQIFMQTGVNVEFTNSRKHTAYELTTNQDIKNLITKCLNTKTCKITQKIFKDLELKFLCIICQDFVSNEGSYFQWIFKYEEQDSQQYPQNKCNKCHLKIAEIEHQLKKNMQKQNLDNLLELLEKIEKEKIKINILLLKKANYEKQKLKHQRDFQETLDSLKVVENYKTIKKSVALLGERLQNIQQQKIILDAEVISEVKQEIQRLNAERNLRHYLLITNFQDFTKKNYEELKDLVDQAKQNNVSKIYVSKADGFLQKMNKILTAQQTLKNFQNYPVREYPPEPKWDKRNKRWLDPVTNKPIDLKKPQILPLKPPKKSKKKKKRKGKQKEEYVIPSWAEDRKNLVDAIQNLTELCQDENLQFTDIFKQESKDQLDRMKRENKYRIRIEKDLKLIEEINSKGKKKK